MNTFIYDYYHHVPLLSLLFSIFPALSCIGVGLSTLRWAFNKELDKNTIFAASGGVGLIILQTLTALVISIYPNAISIFFIIFLIGGFLLLFKQNKFLFKRQGNTISLKTNRTVLDYLTYASLITIILLALIPVSDADSLDYHLGFAADVLTRGKLPYNPEWFHSRLAGSGELLNLAGLYFGGHSFGPLVQLSGLFLVLSSLMMCRSKNSLGNKNFFLLLAVTPFLIIAWLPSAKPFLLGVGISAFLFSLFINTFHLRDGYRIGPNSKRQFILIGVLVGSLVTTKLSFVFSAFLLSMVFIFPRSFALKNLDICFKNFLIFSSGVSVALIPYIVNHFLPFWELSFSAHNFLFGNNFPAYENFFNYLKNWRDNTVIFPLSLVFVDAPGKVTTVIGPTAVLLLITFFLIIRDIKDKTKILPGILVILLFVLLTYFGQKNSRFFYEAFAWALIILCKFYPDICRNRIILNLGKIQASIFIIGGTIFISQGLYSYSSTSARQDFWKKNADGYALGEQVNKDVGENIVGTNFRSRTAFAFQSVSGDWLDFVSNSEEASTYLKIWEANNVTLVLIDDKWGVGISQIIDTCPGKLLATYDYFVGVRNPFNRVITPNKVYLIRLDAVQTCKLETLYLN